ENIELLKDAKTFTVTTGHQLNLMTGPLYFIYKILTAIRLAEALKVKYPDNHFVPVYWMATEDHDFAEINHFSLFGKTFIWEKETKGAVGRIKTEGMEELLKTVPDLPEAFEQAYMQSTTLAEATLKLVHRLFGDKGLIILDADHPRLKSHLSGLAKEELMNKVTQKYVSKTSERLIKLGYSAQAHIREINLFYLKDGLRERIIEEDLKFKICNTDISCESYQLLTEVDNFPENFSPNVLTRPLYQELILPNLAYIGGPAELSYWMQLKSLFGHFQLPFPILFPRTSGMVVNKTTQKKLEKLELDVKDLFMNDEELLKKYVYSKTDTDINLEEERQATEKFFEKIYAKALETDRSLEKYVMAEKQKSLNILSEVEKKLNNAGKKRFETQASQVSGAKDKLFPDGSLQERKDNFLNFYINNPEFLNDLYENIDPFDFTFKIFTEDD
ncbi:MAG: bacillithiol biosynthesis cysteine-adding enzyme BshC, partial [Cytophagaceae bacterium]